MNKFPLVLSHAFTNFKNPLTMNKFHVVISRSFVNLKTPVVIKIWRFLMNNPTNPNK